MGLKYSSFAIRGIDVSDNNGIVDWSKVSANFAITRVGYGRTIDKKFYSNWMRSKGKCKRSAYWYMDYYSNWYDNPTGFVSSAHGLSDFEWGKEQADNCWNELKNDLEGIIWLDIENGGSSYSPPLTSETAKKHAINIAYAFLQRIDALNHKTNGIYTSIGWLSWFTDWFKDRPLWVAWYPYRTSLVGNMSIVQMCLDKGWKCKPLIWQYASDGIFNDDGIKGGLAFSQMQECDLNGWVGTQKQYEEMFDTTVTPPLPDDETEVFPVNTKLIEVKTSTRPVSLRKAPVISFTTFIKLMPAGKEFECLEKKIEGSNIWQRVGIDQWVAEYNNGIQYLK